MLPISNAFFVNSTLFIPTMVVAVAGNVLAHPPHRIEFGVRNIFPYQKTSVYGRQYGESACNGNHSLAIAFMAEKGAWSSYLVKLSV